MKTQRPIEASAKPIQGSSQDLQELISAHPVFKGMRADHLAAVTDCAMKMEFDAGETIFREGDPANRFYLILEGRVALEARAERVPAVLIEEIGAGEVLGWSWLVEPHVWQFDARALEPTVAIFFYGTWLCEVYEEDGSLGYEMMKRVAAVMLQRLQAARRRLVAQRTAEGGSEGQQVETCLRNSGCAQRKTADKFRNERELV